MFHIFFILGYTYVEIIYELVSSYGLWHGYCWDVFDFSAV